MCYIKCDNILNVRKPTFLTILLYRRALYKQFALLLSVYRLHPFCVYVTGETNVASVNVAVNTHQSSRLVWK